MTRSNVPPVNSILARHRLKLRKLPIEWIATHGLKQFGGCIHKKNDTAGNIMVQALYMQRTEQ
ncbi:MAG: hypothetical protein M0P39_00525 [Rhodocyclaceae bacterium]|nr:hypothetical protein [Rhodocyclaceae bacterium]